MEQDWISALIGGVLIGIAVSLMLWWNGRVTGISGIISGLLTPVKGDVLWRAFFILGLVLGGLTIGEFSSKVFSGSLLTETWTVVTAGLLVGFGTVMGSGCTSGHGVCGVSRFSVRSLLATMVFIISGVAAVYFFKKLGFFI